MNMMTAVITTYTEHIASTTLTSTNTLQAKEAAIALAIAHTSANAIITDSQAACRSYLSGQISGPAAKIPPPMTPSTQYLSGLGPCLLVILRQCHGPHDSSRTSRPGTASGSPTSHLSEHHATLQVG